MTDGPTAVIAFGRCDHGDDAAGMMLADILEQHRPGDLTIVRAPTARGDVQEVLRLHDTVYAIDTVRTGDRPGAVRRFDPGGGQLPATYPHGGQQVSLVDVVDAVNSGHNDAAVVLFGIEGRWFTSRAGVSPEVAAAVHDLADQVLNAVTPDA
jgi:hydrogenase maturation protease